MSVKYMNDVPMRPVGAGDGASFQVLIGPDEGPNFAMRRFRIDAGGRIPMHTNLVEHEQLVLRGRARLVIGGQTHDVEKDHVVFIPAGVPHSYTVLGDGPFEFLCLVPNREDRIAFVEAGD